MSAVNRLRILTVCSAICMAGVCSMVQAEDPLVLVSSFTSGEKGAIHALRLNADRGTLKLLQTTPGIENPFFIAVSPDHRFLYSIFAPTFSGPNPEEVASFGLNKSSGQLTAINRKSSKGTASCFLEVDSTGQCLLLANYTTGSVASYALQKDGALSEPVSFVQHTGSSVNADRQKEPHAHCFVISPDNRYAYAADLGIDQIVCYALNAATAELKPARQPFVRTPPGTGPRHLTFHPNGKFLYVINELLNSVTLFDYLSESGMLIERQTISTVPADFTGTSYCADLKITPDGQFLYGTNRGHDSIAAYRLSADGTLTLIDIFPSLGKGPQNLAITANGKRLLCANMPGNSVAVFGIDAGTGRLVPAGDPLEITSPSCIRILE